MTGNSNHDVDDELLSAYVDGELTAAERAQVEERLRTDPAAVAFVEELRGLSAVVKSLPRETVGRDLRATILAKANEARADLAAHHPGNYEPLPPIDRWQGLRRGLVWSAFAIAATLLIALFQPAEENHDPDMVAKAERKIEADDRQEPESASRQTRLADGKETAREHLADADSVPPGLRGGMSAAPASAPAETPADRIGDKTSNGIVASAEAIPSKEEESLSLGAPLDASGTLAEAPSSSITGGPSQVAEGEQQFAAAAPDFGRARGSMGGGMASAGPIAADALPQIVTLRTTGPGGGERLEQLLVESRFALNTAADSPSGQLVGDAEAGIATHDALQGETVRNAQENDANGGGVQITNGVIVEATPQQIQELLAKCRADQRTFAAVEVQSQSASGRSLYFAEGGFGGVGGAGGGPPLINRDGKQLPWARPRELDEVESVAERRGGIVTKEDSTEQLAQLARRKAAPAESPAPVAPQAEQLATRSSLMTPPSGETSSAQAEPRRESASGGEPLASDAPPASRIRVLFLLESADAPPSAVPPTAAPTPADPAQPTE